MRPRGLEHGQGASTDQLPFELGERREDAEHEEAGRRGSVDLRALAGEHPQGHASVRQVLHCVDQMGEVAVETVEFQTTSPSLFLRAPKQLSNAYGDLFRERFPQLTEVRFATR